MLFKRKPVYPPEGIIPVDGKEVPVYLVHDNMPTSEDRRLVGVTTDVDVAASYLNPKLGKSMAPAYRVTLATAWQLPDGSLVSGREVRVFNQVDRYGTE